MAAIDTTRDQTTWSARHLIGTHRNADDSAYKVRL